MLYDVAEGFSLPLWKPKGYQLIMVTILHDAIALLSRWMLRTARTLIARCRRGWESCLRVPCGKICQFNRL